MRKIMFLLLCLGLFGCVNTSFVKYDATIYELTNPETIKIFTFDPPQKHIRIGEIYLAGRVTWGSEIFAKTVKRMAAEMGGDAVVLPPGMLPATGIVIKFKD